MQSSTRRPIGRRPVGIVFSVDGMPRSSPCSVIEMMFERAGAGETQSTVPIEELSTRQRRVLEVIQAYDAATEGQPCPSTVIARRMRLDATTVRKHLAAL